MITSVDKQRKFFKIKCLFLIKKKKKKPISKLDTRELPQLDKETSIETYLFRKRLDAFLQDQK